MHIQTNFQYVVLGLWLVARKGSLRRAVARLGVAFWKGYVREELAPASVLYDVSLPVDGRIPFRADALVAYACYPLIPLSLFGYLYRQAGERVVPDLEALLLHLCQFYGDASKVFRAAPTTFRRTGGAWWFLLLRNIDRERNCAPSLHVATAAYSAYRGLGLVRKYATAENAEEYFHRYAAQVMDSTLFIKQHCVRDVALGLALVSLRHPEFGPMAERLAEKLFAYSGVSVPEVVARECRTVVAGLYHEVVNSINPLDAMARHIKVISRAC